MPSQRDVDSYKRGKMISDRVEAGESFYDIAKEMGLSVHAVRQNAYHWRGAVLKDWNKDDPRRRYLQEVYKALVRQGVFAAEYQGGEYGYA